MNKAWVHWIQGLALSNTICIIALYGPSTLHNLGIITFEKGSDGSNLILLSLLVYMVSCIVLISFVNPPFRKAIIPQQKTIINFYIPYSIILSYVIWGSIVLFYLSQPGAI